jgi:uncharacterized protein
MQRFASWFLLVAALYVSLCASAIADDQSAYGEEPPAPHIALLLPLQSDVFGRAAEAVQQGFMAAANAQPHNLPVRIYASFDEQQDILTTYQHALASGAQAVVGPLTRSGVATLAANPNLITVPTLALNVTEGIAPNNLYYFGLSAEDEARQIAQIAAASKLTSANIISTDTPLSRRLAQAFADTWVNNGGTIATNTIYNGDASIFATLPGNAPPIVTPNQSADTPASTQQYMVFLAADPDTARLIRPYISVALPTFSTSQIFAGNNDMLRNYDLNEVYFVGMPWLLQPDHPAVMIYPRPETALGPDMERLYALGIDAFRLVQILLANSELNTLPLDGVTGTITLNGNHQFVREGVQAEFAQGKAATTKIPAAVAAQLKAVADAAAAAAAAASAAAATSTLDSAKP